MCVQERAGERERNHGCGTVKGCVSIAENLPFNYLQQERRSIITCVLAFSCMIEFDGISAVARHFRHNECDRCGRGQFRLLLLSLILSR